MGSEFTELIRQAAGGDTLARDRAFVLVEHELRRIAQHMLGAYRGGRAGLQATEVVSLACVKLLEGGRLEPEGRRHFFFLLTRAMGDVLRDEEDRARAAKRGGNGRQVPLAEFAVDDEQTTVLASELLQALEELRAIDPDAARVAELRFLAGRSLRATGELLSMTLATVRGNWDYARAWLAERLDPTASRKAGARPVSDPGR